MSYSSFLDITDFTHKSHINHKKLYHSFGSAVNVMILLDTIIIESYCLLYKYEIVTIKGRFCIDL